MKYISVALYNLLIVTAVVFATDSDVVVLRAVRGRDARLPCGRGKIFLDGPEAYVVWIKNDRDVLYRFPNEDSDKGALSFDRLYGTSCNGGDSCHDVTSLLLKRVGEHDEGMYRCRVHYHASPSIDYVIELQLVESSGSLKIFNENGKQIEKSYIGPLSLGSNYTFICVVNESQPDTMVYWRRNGELLQRAQATEPSVQRGEIQVFNATRNELDARYECVAKDADVTEPLTASVVVKMYLPPLSVQIRLNENYDFEAGQPRVVDCVVMGCVPPPTITWHLGNIMLRSNVHKELHDGNYTVSSLTLAPSMKDNRNELVCRAHNTYMPNNTFEDKAVLTVGYRPMCHNARVETIGAVEKEIEVVSCMVGASPAPAQFTWTFADSRTLYTNVKKVPGHDNRYSSTLTWIPRDGDLGVLLCRATNSFGEQKTPCSFTVSNGGPPLTPKCVVLNSYTASWRIQCKKSWDGGRPQTIHLELHDGNGALLVNESDPTGDFNLKDTDTYLNLTAVVYASSVRGRSAVKIINLENPNPPAPSKSEESDDTLSAAMLFWVEMVAGVLVMAVVAGLIMSCVRTTENIPEDPEQVPDLVPRPCDGSFHREPEFEREERLAGTNITVNQLAPYQTQYSSSPLPTCRVVVGCGPHPDLSCPTIQHSYFV